MKLNNKKFTLMEALVAVGLFTMISLSIMEVFEGSKKNINEMLNREEVSMIAMKSLSNVQESIHQAAELYNHVPVSSSDDAEANLFYARIGWDDIPKRMGTDLGNPDYHNRLPDVKGQTQAISDWKAANLNDEYAVRFHDNDLLMSLQPNGPGMPSNSRGYAGNVLLIARHLKPIEIVLSPTDADYEDSVLNPESHFYKESRQKGHQIHVYTGSDSMPGDERMYSIDVIRFELYYLTEDKIGSWKKAVSMSNDTLYREDSLRLVKAESIVYLVHSKFETLKDNLQAAYDNDQTKATDSDPSDPYTAVVPNDFDHLFEALTNTSDGVYFESIAQSREKVLLTQTVEYTDNATGLVLRDLDSGASNGFAGTPVTDNIDFPESTYHTFVSNDGVGGHANITVGYNTKWTSGETLDIKPGKHIPWFAQQPELSGVSPVSDLFPGGFEVSGAGFGNKQRVSVRLCLWLRTYDDFSSYSHFVIGARAQ